MQIRRHNVLNEIKQLIGNLPGRYRIPLANVGMLNDVIPIRGAKYKFSKNEHRNCKITMRRHIIKNNQSTESTERWHLRFTLTIERQYRYIKEYIWFIYEIAPFFSDLKNLLETKNNSRFYILKLFFLLHGNRFGKYFNSKLVYFV